MKEASIRFRLSIAERAAVRDWATSSGKPASELIRAAIRASMAASPVGLRERKACAAARLAANTLINGLAERPVDVDRLRSAAVQMRDAARQILMLS